MLKYIKHNIIYIVIISKTDTHTQYIQIVVDTLWKRTRFDDKSVIYSKKLEWREGLKEMNGE